LRITAVVEAQIRKRPAEWFWVHRRWGKDAYRGLAADND
jgi:KDO2-lipid IV(A) lauroyltransferase